LISAKEFTDVILVLIDVIAEKLKSLRIIMGDNNGVKSLLLTLEPIVLNNRTVLSKLSPNTESI